MLNRTGRFLVSALIGVALPAWSTPVSAQSITSGSLRGVVLGEGRAPLAGVFVTVEQLDGRVLGTTESDRGGRYAFGLLHPGSYRVLVEQIGFQPVRYLGVPIAPGQTTVLNARLEVRPPPILEVTEVPWEGALAGATIGQTYSAGALTRFDQRLEAVDLSEAATGVDAPRNGMDGLVFGANGLGAGSSRLWVDGLPEQMIRHAGLPNEPGYNPLFYRAGLSFAQMMGGGFDAEWRGYPGTVLNAHSARGGNRVSFRPYAYVSGAGLGGNKDDNPADSSATTVLIGAALSGAIVPDTAHFYLRFDYQNSREPTAYPWEQDSTSYDGAVVSLRESLPVIGTDVFGQDLTRWVAPVVRSRVGFSGQGRFDWLISGNQVAARFGYARMTEEQPSFGPELSNLNGVELKTTDASAGLSVTSGGGGRLANELRLGFTTARREWMGVSLPSTSLAAEGIAFGSSAALPATFERRTFDLSEALHYTAGAHRLKLGGYFQTRDDEQDYRFGSQGLFAFGSLDGFAAGEGSFYQSVAGPSPTRVRPRSVGSFRTPGGSHPRLTFSSGCGTTGSFFRRPRSAKTRPGFRLRASAMP